MTKNFETGTEKINLLRKKKTNIPKAILRNELINYTRIN